jgi:hypothetical protein
MMRECHRVNASSAFLEGVDHASFTLENCLLVSSSAMRIAVARSVVCEAQLSSQSSKNLNESRAK